MNVFASAAAQEPSAVDGALQAKRALARSFHQLETTLSVIRRIAEQYGQAELAAALGTDRAEVVKLYQALKAVVEKNKPGTSVPDLQL